MTVRGNTKRHQRASRPRARWTSLLLGALLATCMLLTMPAIAGAAGPTSCPSPRDRDEDYMCPLGPSFTTPALTDLAGWGQPSHWGNIAYGDIEGTGTDDLVARGSDGVQVYRWSPAAAQWLQLEVPPILPDRDGWGQTLRMHGFDLGDIDGDGRDELVARGDDGIVVFKFMGTRGGNGGHFEQLTTSGPFPTSGWRAPEYYRTMELTPIGALPGKHTMQIAARGQQGFGMWRWNGNGWSPLNGLTAVSDANGFDDPHSYLTIQAWNDQLLFARARSGMAVYRYEAKGNRWERLSADGPCPIDAAQHPASFPCATHTIQLVHGIKGAGSDPVLLARDPRAGKGMQLARFDVSKRKWVYRVEDGSPWHESKYGEREYGTTVQAADVDGDGFSEVLGRSDAGAAVFRPQLNGDGGVSWGPPASLGRPKLVGKPWQLAGHFATLETVHVRPDSKARSLVARGPYGIRTWNWDANRNRWQRPHRYGAFPAIDANVLDGISDWLGIARGSVRDVFTDPSRDPSAGRLAELQRRLESTCDQLEHALPPRFERCSTPRGVRGVTDVAWTKAANELIAELYWARNVVEYFDRLETTQVRLFLDQLGEFPSITKDLALKTPPVKFGVDPDQIIGMTLETIIGLDIPVLKHIAGVAGLTLGWIAAATPRFTGEQPSEFKVKASELQAEMAKLHQEMRDALVRHRRYVIADPGLLQTVGRQVASGAWSYDDQLLQSAARQSFTRELYESILPTLWDHWVVLKCTPIGAGGRIGFDGKPTASCHAPDSGPLLRVVTNPKGINEKYPSVNFDGLVPKQNPCDDDFHLFENRRCRWQSLERHGYTSTIETLLHPIPAHCRYDPAAGTSWRYGCPLGVAAHQLLSPGPHSPWKFWVRRCDYPRFNQPEVSCHVAAE